MSDHRVGETGLSNSGPSSQPLAYGLHGFSPAATNFFDQEGAAYFEELQEALMQGVVGIRSDEDTKTYLTNRPPTLEIFPSWPMRFNHNAAGNSQSAESSDSGSAQNTISQLESESPVSRKDDYSELFSEKKQHQQQEQMIPTVSSKTEIATAGNHQSRDQDKFRATEVPLEDNFFSSLLNSSTFTQIFESLQPLKELLIMAFYGPAL